MPARAWFIFLSSIFLSGFPRRYGPASSRQIKLCVRLTGESNGNGKPALQIEVRDNGADFMSEAAQKVSSPFFSTRNVGLGLGLAVPRKIVETHAGKLGIVPFATAKAGVVRISLPLSAPAEA